MKRKDQQTTGSAAPQSLPPPPLPPQTTGVVAGTGQRATSSVMALVHGENGVLQGELVAQVLPM